MALFLDYVQCHVICCHGKNTPQLHVEMHMHVCFIQELEKVKEVLETEKHEMEQLAAELREDYARMKQWVVLAFLAYM